jgi:nucleotide-binding universal stress UspA family protein
MVATFKRILIAVDDSPIAAHAANVGFDLARALQGDAALIMVVDPAQTCLPESGIPSADQIALAEQDAKRLLAEIGARSDMQPRPLTFAPVGKPADKIVDAAKDWPADLIVLGSHGRGGVSRLVLGSVAEAVMRHAPCPLLIVRAGS